MNFLKRTDLACEKTEAERSNYYISKESVYDIDALCSKHKADSNRKNIILTVGKVWMYNEKYRLNTSLAISEYINKMICSNAKRFLIVGLGNRLITSDSLGAFTIDELYPTVNIRELKNKIFILAPGVEGQSGIPTFDVVKSAITLSSADTLILVDSLCSASIERLLTTVQISTEGIMPGSGVGNHKKEISQKTVGIPVIWIGVPTVIDLNKYKNTCFNYFVSPNDIDISIKSLSKIIAKGIEIALYK